MDKTERDLAIKMALGRMFSIMVRPFEPGDVEQYENCRAVVLDCLEPVVDYAPNYVRDRNKGASGD